MKGKTLKMKQVTQLKYNYELYIMSCHIKVGSCNHNITW
jgi:hypothetical protein